MSDSRRPTCSGRWGCCTRSCPAPSCWSSTREPSPTCCPSLPLMGTPDREPDSDLPVSTVHGLTLAPRLPASPHTFSSDCGLFSFALHIPLGSDFVPFLSSSFAFILPCLLCWQLLSFHLEQSPQPDPAQCLPGASLTLPLLKFPH